MSGGGQGVAQGPAMMQPQGAGAPMQQGGPGQQFQYGHNPNTLPGPMGQIPVNQGGTIVGPNGLPGWLGQMPMGQQTPPALPQGPQTPTPPYQYGRNPNPLPGSMGQIPVNQGGNIVGPNGLPGFLGRIPMGQQQPQQPQYTPPPAGLTAMPSMPQQAQNLSPSGQPMNMIQQLQAQQRFARGGGGYR